MPSVTHVITELDVGGAELALGRLVPALAEAGIRSRVVSLRDLGPAAQGLADAGISVDAVGMTRGLGAVAGMVRLKQLLRRERPDVVQTWLYHGDVIGGLAARAAGVPHIVWGLRGTRLERATRMSTRLVARAGARLSRRVPTAIVCCGEAVRRAHVALGYDERRMVVIPNGVPLPEPQHCNGTRLRAELGVGPDAVLVGRVGRFHPEKDHATFLRAAARVLDARPFTHLVLCGLGIDPGNRSLAGLLAEVPRREQVHLLGLREDMNAVYSALDLLCSSSVGEGFPNTVAEAMAFGVPAVVTDVGDSALVVGDTGVVVPPSNPAALAAALERLIDDPPGRRALGVRARERVARELGVARMAERYISLYERLVDKGG